MGYATPSEAVGTRLLATAGVTSLVGQRAYPSKPTQDCQWPYLVFYKTAGGDGMRLDGPTRLNDYTMRVDVYAQTEAAAEAILAAVVAALSGWSDRANGVQGCFPVADADEQVNDDGTQASGQSFRLFFQT